LASLQLRKASVDRDFPRFVQMYCIFCNSADHEETVEHIVPRSLGNLHYILPRGVVCRRCNSRFAKYENQVLSSSLFLEERRRLGLLRERNDTTGTALPDSAMARFMLKMGYEALYKSRYTLWQATDFSALRTYLVQGAENDLFRDRSASSAVNFRSIPRWMDRFRLRNNHLRLEYAIDGDRLFFRFRFGSIQARIRLV
jgi:hypothetical protein